MIYDRVNEFGATYEEVKSGDESWKGYYLYSRIGEYFEILEGSRIGGFGLAFSTTYPKLFNTKRIVESVKEHHWMSGVRYTEVGDKWFDWYSINDYLSQQTLFNVWVISYYDRHIETTSLPKRKSVLTFNSIEFDVGKSLKAEIQNLLKLPLFQNINLSENLISFDIYKKDGELFNVKFFLSNEEIKFNPRSVKMSMIKDNMLIEEEIGFL